MSQKDKKLTLDFYHCDTIDVARHLLGKTLVRILPGGQRLSGRIVETEAYLGGPDPASHGYGERRTPRTETLFLPGGHAYIYFIYGMYFCFNVVTQKADVPEAVLIRAVEPLDNVEIMKQQRQKEKLIELASGPGKLCQALAINAGLNKKSLLGDEIFIEDASPIPEEAIADSPRIGVDYAGDAAAWPLRFFVRDNPHVSRR